MTKHSRPFTPEISLSPYPVIEKSWGFSTGRMDDLTVALAERFKDRNDVSDLTVVVAGSYGRFDASEHSDLDFMLISDGDVDKSVAEKVQSEVREVASDLSFPLPNPDGVFGTSTSYQQLLTHAGSRDDTFDSLAQRMLLLMECRPVFNEELFSRVQSSVLDKYLEYVTADPTKEALYLLNDLIRYFRTMCVNYQFSFWNQNEKWVIRNIKLRHSRVLLYTGLLFVILNASTYDDKGLYIREMMSKTPLERIVAVYRDSGDKSYTRLLAQYDLFLMKLQDPAVREGLQLDYEHRFSSPTYREMKVTSVALTSELTRFVLAHRDRWTEAAFEYLWF